MTVTQLNPGYPVETAKGKGRAFMVIDYGEEDHVLWGVVLDEADEYGKYPIWWIPNPEVWMRPNWSMGRRSITKES